MTNREDQKQELEHGKKDAILGNLLAFAQLAVKVNLNCIVCAIVAKLKSFENCLLFFHVMLDILAVNDYTSHCNHRDDGKWPHHETEFGFLTAKLAARILDLLLTKSVIDQYKERVNEVAHNACHQDQNFQAANFRNYTNNMNMKVAIVCSIVKNFRFIMLMAKYKIGEFFRYIKRVEHGLDLLDVSKEVLSCLALLSIALNVPLVALSSQQFQLHLFTSFNLLLTIEVKPHG